MGWAWCSRKNIALDDTVTFADEGVSAFRSKNRKVGGLANFLAACKQGRIAKSSYLIVENLDRLCRDHPLEGQGLMKELLRDYGIIVVTIAPEWEFNYAKLDMVRRRDTR